MPVPTLDNLMDLSKAADAAQAAQLIAEKEIGQATRRAAKKAEAHKAAVEALASAKAAYAASLAPKK